jgi:hypothetical protein
MGSTAVHVSAAPTLAHELTYHADLDFVQVGSGPFGSRTIANVTGGEFRGPRLQGTIVGAGADWLLAGPDGFGRLDVRATFQTGDGALIYVQYHGLIELTDAVLAIIGGGPGETAFGGQYFFTNPRMETGDERYGWVNRVFLVGQGRLVAGPRVEYRVFRMENAA